MNPYISLIIAALWLFLAIAIAFAPHGEETSEGFRRIK